MDLALPVADVQQANLIVSVGFHVTLGISGSGAFGGESVYVSDAPTSR